MHSFDWRGEAHPEGHRPPKVPGPLSTEAQLARAPREVTGTIHFNGDYSGNVKINVPTWVGDPSTHNFTSDGEDYHIAQLSVPFAMLKAFVLEHYRELMISALQDADDEELEDLVVWANDLASMHDLTNKDTVKHMSDGGCCAGKAGF